MHPLLARAEAVVFDFDGVLVDSEPLHEEAIRQTAAAQRGWAMTRDHFHQMVGKGDPHAFELLARVHGTSVTGDEIASLCEHKHARSLELIAAGRFSVQPGAVELAGRISASRPAGVCSGSRREVVRGMLDRSGLAPHMRCVVTHEDVKRPKPDPEGYRLAARLLGTSPEKCVVIEDSPTGIRAAVAAGMTVIAVCHSFNAERLTEAHLVIATIADLLRAGGPTHL